MSPVIIDSVLRTRPVLVPVAVTPRLLAVGSILHDAREGDVLWGTGSLRPDDLRAKGVRPFAVRGPLTASAFGQHCPDVFGDPVRLLPEVFNPEVEKLSGKVGLVPHHADIPKLKDLQLPGVTVIRPTLPWRKVVREILACEHIVSSSLHGIVVADAYGIPASWCRVGDLPRGGEHKFFDYLLGSGREECEPHDIVAGGVPDEILPPPAPLPAAFLQAGLDAVEALKT